MIGFRALVVEEFARCGSPIYPISRSIASVVMKRPSKNDTQTEQPTVGPEAAVRRRRIGLSEVGKITMVIVKAVGHPYPFIKRLKRSGTTDRADR
jgi:hypothetical protein